MSETIVVPDNGNNMNNAWPWMAMNNGGFGGLGNGLGAGVVGFILGALINGNGKKLLRILGFLYLGGLGERLFFFPFSFLSFKTQFLKWTQLSIAKNKI